MDKKSKKTKKYNNLVKYPSSTESSSETDTSSSYRCEKREKKKEKSLPPLDADIKTSLNNT